MEFLTIAVLLVVIYYCKISSYLGSQLVFFLLGQVKNLVMVINVHICSCNLHPVYFMEYKYKYCSTILFLVIMLVYFVYV